MGNRDKAKELRAQQTQENKTQTQEALALQAEGKQNVVSIEKVQEELDNTKSMLKDVQADKEELQEALDTAKSTEAELSALLQKRDQEIVTLKMETESLAAELAESKKQVTALKTKVTKLENK